MIKSGELYCPKCNSKLQYLDSTNRIVKQKNGKIEWKGISRFKCKQCGNVHREIPKWIFPYKHYDSEIIIGVCQGTITSETLGYENYPCEMTMKRWIKSIQLEDG